MCRFPLGASGWKQPLCVTPQRPWRLASWRQTAFFCHQLGHKPRSQQVLTLGCEARHTNRGATTQQDLLLLENMGFASCSALWSIWRHGNAIKIEFTWGNKNLWN